MQNPASFNAYLQTVGNPAWSKPTTRAPTGGSGTQFAARLATPDPEDSKWFFRNSKITDGKTPAGLAIAPNEFFDYLERKKDSELYAQYQAWAINQSDMSTPEARAYWNKILGWVAEKRDSLVEEQANIQKKIAKLKIHGIQSEEDMMFLFALNNGLINVAAQPLYNIDAADESAYPSDKRNDEQKYNGKYTSGMFSPYRKFFVDREWRDGKVSLSDASSITPTNFPNPNNYTPKFTGPTFT